MAPSIGAAHQTEGVPDEPSTTEPHCRSRRNPYHQSASVASALRISEVLIHAGMPLIEVTFTVPRAAEVIRQLRGTFPKLLIGAGTVLDQVAARNAIEAEATFLVSVAAPPKVIAAGHQAGIPVIPGAFTPSEIIAVLALGVEVVKLFPASVGGPGYLRALREPLPSLRAIPTGGVNAVNVHEWFAAGAVAVGVGSALIRDVATTGDYEGLRQRAVELMAAVQRARGPVQPR